MFHREIKVNYGTIEEIVKNIVTYKNAIEQMRESIGQIWALIEGNTGKAHEALEEQKETILGQMDDCEQELEDMEHLLASGYDKPPYSPDFEVKVVQAGNEEYVRVFSYNADGTSNKLGGWLMKKSDIEG